MPRVSVILNCYNHEAYVGEAVDSVLAQTFADFELILIDNGSTDGSRGVLKGFKDKRIRRAFHDSNESLSRRLNQGVAMAKGEFIAVLYSDDLMLPDKLERQVAMFDRLPADFGVVYCPAIGFNQFTGVRWTHHCHGLSGAMYPEWFRQHWQGHIDMSSPLTRRTCLAKRPWHEDLPFEGEAVFMRVALDAKFYFDPQPTVMLRDHDSNAGKAVRRNVEMAEELTSRFRADKVYPKSLDRDVDWFLANLNLGAGWITIRTLPEERSWGAQQYRKAIRRSPRIAAKPRYLLGAVMMVLPAKAVTWLNRQFDRRSNYLGNRQNIRG